MNIMWGVVHVFAFIAHLRTHGSFLRANALLQFSFLHTIVDDVAHYAPRYPHHHLLQLPVCAAAHLMSFRCTRSTTDVYLTTHVNISVAALRYPARHNTTRTCVVHTRDCWIRQQHGDRRFSPRWLVLMYWYFLWWRRPSF